MLGSKNAKAPHLAGLGVGMESWGWGLALKPFIAVLLFVALFGGAKLIAWLIHKVMPDSRLKRELFATTPDELPAARSDRSGDPPDGLLK